MKRSQRHVLILFAIGILCITVYPPWDVECPVNPDPLAFRLGSRVGVEYGFLFEPESLGRYGSCRALGISVPTISAMYVGWILLMGSVFLIGGGVKRAPLTEKQIEASRSQQASLTEKRSEALHSHSFGDDDICMHCGRIRKSVEHLSLFCTGDGKKG